MQWKKTETNGLKTEICPRKVHELAAFGNYLTELAKKIKFQTIRNHFQKRLQQDIKTIKKTNKTVIFADKSTNMYKLTKEQYDKWLKIQ